MPYKQRNNKIKLKVVNLKAYHSCELVVSSVTKPPLCLTLGTKLLFLSAAKSDFKLPDLAAPSYRTRGLTDIKASLSEVT